MSEASRSQVSNRVLYVFHPPPLPNNLQVNSGSEVVLDHDHITYPLTHTVYFHRET